MDENLEPGARGLQKVDDISLTAEREKPVSPQKLLSAVANDHRRIILSSLTRASNKTLKHDALVDCVADRLKGENPELTSDEHRQRARIALTHTHLPKLEEARIIDYETETGLVQFVGGELEQDLLTLIEPYDTDE